VCNPEIRAFLQAELFQHFSRPKPAVCLQWRLLAQHAWSAAKLQGNENEKQSAKRIGL
jgi:hypothetical protein